MQMLNLNKAKVNEIDDHELHISEHIAFMLGWEYDKKQTTEMEKLFLEHIPEHK